MKCLVLAAGYATRLYPITENFPKPLLEVRNKTILDWLLDDIDETQKVDEYIIISNHKYIDYFVNWAQTKELFGIITIIDDGTISNETRLGAVCDIDLAIQKLDIDDDLMVIAGDNLLDFSLAEFITYFETKKATCIMRYFESNVEKIKKSAQVKINENDLIYDMVEKPENPSSNWCAPPFYIYAHNDVKKVRKALENGCKKDAPGSFIQYLYNKSNVYAMEMPGKRYDIGSIDSYNFVCEEYNGNIQKKGNIK